MKKFIIIVSYSIYLFFFFGFVFHSSANPVIFGKYTIKNIIAISALLIFFPLFLYFINYLLKTSNIKITYNKKKIKLTPLRKMLCVLFIIIIAIVPCELYFRNKFSQSSRNGYLFTIDNYHPFLGLQVTNTKDLHINSYGFRGDEIGKNKNSKTYRIFIQGGSTVFNGNIVYEKTFSYLLQKQLQKQFPNKKIEVINAGVDGYTSEHSIIQYLFNIHDFSPDLVILWQGINDWYYSCTPQYLTHGSYKSDYSHYFGANSNMVNNYFTPEPVVSFHLITFDRLVKFLGDNLYSDVFAYLNKINKKGIYEVNTNTYNKNYFPSKEAFKRNMQYFVDSVKKDNTMLLLGNQAFLYSKNMSVDVGRALYFPQRQCSVNGKYPDLQSVINSMNEFNTISQKLAENNNIPFVDIQKSIPKTLDYFTDDVHYTVKGNEYIANLLFKKIIEEKLIQE